MFGAGFGNYMILESNSVVPNLIKDPESKSDMSNQLWDLYFDGSRNKDGVGVGVMLVSPNGDKFYATFKLSFPCSNNVAKYESLIQGLEWARLRGIKCLRAFGDSEIIFKQVRGINTVKNDLLKMYKSRVSDILDEFDAFNLISIPRRENLHVDRLAGIGAHMPIIENKGLVSD